MHTDYHFSILKGTLQMQKLSNQEKWHPLKGVLLNFAALLLLITVGRYLGNTFGLWGIMMYETMFCLLAVGYTLIQKTPLKEVFPIHIPTLRHAGASILMWIGAGLLGFLSIYLAYVIFPNIFISTASGISKALTNGSPLLSIVVTSIFAPICEESLERGAVFSHFRGLKREWVAVLIIGLFFGIMHTDPIRFMNTAIMGATFAYIMVKTNNILIPVSLHFMSNFGASILSLINQKNISTDEAMDMLQTISPQRLLGAAMMLFFAGPLIMTLGIQLFRPKIEKDAPLEERRERQKKCQRELIIATCISCAIMLIGAILMVTDPQFKEALAQSQKIINSNS